MGDKTQFTFAKHVFKNFTGSVLEIGSKDYGNTQNFRQIFPNCNYCGVDLEKGKNVDFVINLENGLGPLENEKFDLIIICSVLEHTKKPWVVANNLLDVLSSNGAIYSCHPWVWSYHKYPDDFFRFSPRGIQILFEGITYWLPSFYGTFPEGALYSFSKNEFIDNDLAIVNEQNRRKFLPYLQTFMVGTRSKDTAVFLEQNLNSVINK